MSVGNLEGFGAGLASKTGKQQMKFDLDRLVTIHLVSPVMQATPARRLSIPVLMYHSIAEEEESGVRAYYRTSTSPTVFRAHMELLYREGYRVCSPSEAVRMLADPRQPIIKAAVITFDDGYRNNYETAFPILNEFGFGATIYLPTSYIADSTVEFKGRKCLNWDEVREMQKHGVSFGSHTVNHPQLDGLDKSTIEMELKDSKSAIEDKTGSAVESFAYPYAFPQTKTQFKDMLRHMLYEAGYRNGVCTAIGLATSGSDPLFLERLPVNTCDDSNFLGAKLIGAYNWMGKSQVAIKTAKRWKARVFRSA
jgi:peptidoglycan/xylan/chitin deacetylase (PgdA/CDA1 family)